MRDKLFTWLNLTTFTCLGVKFFRMITRKWLFQSFGWSAPLNHHCHCDRSNLTTGESYEKLGFHLCNGKHREKGKTLEKGKTSIFWCFQWVEKGCNGNKWFNFTDDFALLKQKNTKAQKLLTRFEGAAAKVVSHLNKRQ